MTVAGDAQGGSKGRRRGGPLRIERSRIIEVAKTFDPQTMTMQAVADEMGVDRKALNYHVTDREGLLRLVAEEVFESHFSEAFWAELDRGGGRERADWRGSVRAWAAAVRDSMVATGIATNYYQISGDNPAVFEPVEFVLQSMLAAGFDHNTASRGVISLTRIAMGVGRDIVLESQAGEHPQGPEVRRLLPADGQPTKYEALQQIISAELNSLTDMPVQFDFELDIFIAGMQQRLPRGPRPRAHRSAPVRTSAPTG